MLITFKSKGAGDIQMFAEHAEQILQIIGKSLDPATAPRGIITAAQAPAALAALRAAADAARSTAAPASDVDAQGRPRVSLAQRAFPLISMLERAASKGLDIVWGV
jgi:hypothetical protein